MTHDTCRCDCSNVSSSVGLSSGRANRPGCVWTVETNAHGQATFQLNKAGDELSYKLIVTNIENVTQAHIHQAPAGENGSVVAWLYPEDGPPAELIAGRFDGVLAESTITADDLVGPLEDEPLEELLDGEAYVNVHTQAHPGGEVRGQIR